MKIYVHLSDLAKLLLEWRMFQTRVVEKIKTHFISFLKKITPFMRRYGKIWYSQTGHRSKYNMANALYMLVIQRYKHTQKI